MTRSGRSRSRPGCTGLGRCGSTWNHPSVPPRTRTFLMWKRPGGSSTRSWIWARCASRVSTEEDLLPSRTYVLNHLRSASASPGALNTSSKWWNYTEGICASCDGGGGEVEKGGIKYCAWFDVEVRFGGACLYLVCER